MPSGKIHDRITWMCLPGVVVGGLVVTRDVVLTLCSSVAFMFSGLMFGPDLDIYSLQYKRWGFLRVIWLPYQRLLKHRSFFSHGILIGTMGRIVYLTSVVVVLGVLLGIVGRLIVGVSWDWGWLREGYTRVKEDYWQEGIAVFLGLELGAMSHYLADLGENWRQRRLAEKKIKKGRKRVKGCKTKDGKGENKRQR